MGHILHVGQKHVVNIYGPENFDCSGTLRSCKQYLQKLRRISVPPSSVS